MQKPEIRYFDPRIDKIADFKLILLLSDKVKIIDRQKNEEIEDIDGKCILIRFEDKDSRKRNPLEYTHQDYFNVCKSYYDIVNISHQTLVNQIIEKILQLFERKIQIRDVVESLIELLREMSIITFYNFGEYDQYGQKFECLKGELFYSSNLSSKQKKSLKNLLMQLYKEKYDLDGIIIPHSDSLNLNTLLENKQNLCYGVDMLEIDLEAFMEVLGITKSSDRSGYNR